MSTKRGKNNAEGRSTRHKPTEWKDAYSTLLDRIVKLEKIQKKNTDDLNELNKNDTEDPVSNTLIADVNQLREDFGILEKKVSDDGRLATLEKTVKEVDERTSVTQLDEWYNQKRLEGINNPSHLTPAEANARNNILDENELRSNGSYRQLVDQ